MSSFPRPTPAALFPIPRSPAAEQGTVYHAPLTIFEEAFLAIRSPGENAKNLDVAGVGINPKRAVSHAKDSILTRQILQSVGDIDVAPRCAILSAQYDELTRVAGRVLCQRKSR